MKNLSASWKRGFDTAKAARLHSNGTRPGEKLGAALYSGSILVSIGFNTFYKSHPDAKLPTYLTGIHAEHCSLLKRRYCEDKDLTLYVYRETQSNKGVITPAVSRPCANCFRIIQLANVKRIRFINEKGLPEELKL